MTNDVSSCKRYQFFHLFQNLSIISYTAINHCVIQVVVIVVLVLNMMQQLSVLWNTPKIKQGTIRREYSLVI